jgi:hypothetical protein
MSNTTSPPSETRAVFFGMSAPVMTALTPGTASAAVVSIDTTRAWACGLRTSTPCSIPGSVKSAP